MPRRYKIFQLSAKALASYAEEKENDVYETHVDAPPSKSAYEKNRIYIIDFIEVLLYY